MGENVILFEEEFVATFNWDGQQALLPHLMPIEAEKVQSGIERSRADVSKHDTWGESLLSESR